MSVMAKKKGKARTKRRLEPEASAGPSAAQVEQRLLATSFPRLQMVLILSLAAIATFLCSASLVQLGVGRMGLRYALAVVGGYVFFLSLVRVWIAYQTRNWRFGRATQRREERSSSNVNVDLPDLSGLAELGNSAEGFAGLGGEFGGAGASASFGDLAAADVGGSGGSEAAGALDGLGNANEGLPILLAILAVLGGLIALGFVVYSSPILFAEVLLDVAVVGALYKKNKRHERGHWAAGVLRRTYKPVLVLALFAGVFGFALQSLAPEESTLGAVLAAHDAKKHDL
jgi:hypothetical protein